MKEIFFALFALTTIASCSKSDGLGGTSGGGVPEDRVEILLNSGVQTKAPIISGTSFTAQVAGWESAGAVDYTTGTPWVTTAVVTAQTTSQAVTLAERQYYTETIKTYIKAWYPLGVPANGIVTFPAPDGVTDVLFASEIVGDKVNSTGKTLAFTHKLSQIQFKVVSDISMTTTPTLTSITIIDAQLPTGINLTTDDLTYAAAANLNIPGINPQQIPTTAAPAGDPVMIKPIAGNTFKIKVVTSDGTYKDADVTISDTDFVPGKAYAITLTFKSKDEIKLSATVAEWQVGSGSATIE